MPSEPAKPASGYVLVVEDDLSSREFLRLALSRRGLSVTGCECAEDALREVRARIPDLVLLDLEMPGMGGLAFLREVRRTLGPMPVLVVTAWDDAERREEVRNLRADFLTKPVGLEILYRTVDRLLRPPGSERRRAPRVRMRLGVDPGVPGAGTAFAAEVVDISRIGCCFRWPVPAGGDPAPPAAGGDIRFVLQWEDGGRDEVRARVAHRMQFTVDAPVYLGCEFVEVAGTFARRLQEKVGG